MVIGSFKDNDAEMLFLNGRVPRKCGWASLSRIVQRKLDMMHFAKELKDLRNPPNNRLESLSGDFEGYYSIRINDQWRIVFKWEKQPYEVRIMDYH